MTAKFDFERYKTDWEAYDKATCYASLYRKLFHVKLEMLNVMKTAILDYDFDEDGIIELFANKFGSEGADVVNLYYHFKGTNGYGKDVYKEHFNRSRENALIEASYYDLPRDYFMGCFPNDDYLRPVSNIRGSLVYKLNGGKDKLTFSLKDMVTFNVYLNDEVICEVKAIDLENECVDKNLEKIVSILFDRLQCGWREHWDSQLFQLELKRIYDSV